MWGMSSGADTFKGHCHLDSIKLKLNETSRRIFKNMKMLMPFDFKLHSLAQQLLLYFHLWATQSCNPNGSSPTSREAQTLYMYMVRI